MTTSFALTEKSTRDTLANGHASGSMEPRKGYLAYEYEDLTGGSGTAEGAAGSDPVDRTEN
jgi:hypothetical protein